jgi:hypothetical protein
MHTYSGAHVAAQAAIANAVKASGAIVQMHPDQFLKLLEREKEPVVVTATGWMFGTKYKYLFNYRGFFFYTESRTQLRIPSGAEIIAAEKIWVPSGM